MRIHQEGNRIVLYTLDPLHKDGQSSSLSPEAIHAAHSDISTQRADALEKAHNWTQTHIEETAWRIERAAERERLGLPGETLEEVLLHREAIRRASNRLEVALDAADTIEQIQTIEFEITENDRATPTRIERQEFMDRFTQNEMEAILAAANVSTAVAAWLERFRVVGGVVLTDPRTIAGVQALEIAGLIGTGRAEEILTHII